MPKNLNLLASITSLSIAAFVPCLVFAASPPLGQSDGGGCVKPPDNQRPLCSVVESNMLYPKSDGVGAAFKAPTNPKPGPRCGGNTGYIADPAVPGQTLSWHELRGALTRYCVQPRVVNTGNAATPANQQVFLVGDKDFPLTTTPFGTLRRMATIAVPIPGKGATPVAETWCVELPSTAAAPNLSLFLNVPAQNLLIGAPTPSGTGGTDSATPASSNTTSAKVASATAPPRIRGIIKA